MSARKRSRGGRNRRMWLPSGDDFPLLALLGVKTTPRRRNTTPRGRGRARRTVAAAPVAPITPQIPTEVINLEDTPESSAILNNVNTKVGAFMQTGSFISSDEDETEMIIAKCKKRSSPNRFLFSDDSDDDCELVRPTSDFSSSEPGTSGGAGAVFSKNQDEQNSLDDMDFVDSVLNDMNSKKDEVKQNPAKNIRSLEDFRKETEEMLKNASTLLDEIKTGRKTEPPAEEESPNRVTVGSCPICLEGFAGRPAAVTVCGHIFCQSCITQTAKALKKCPTCRKPISTKKIHPIYF